MRPAFRLALIITTVSVFACACAGGGRVEEADIISKPVAESAITIGGEIGLSSIVSLSDAHFQKMADSL